MRAKKDRNIRRECIETESVQAGYGHQPMVL